MQSSRNYRLEQWVGVIAALVIIASTIIALRTMLAPAAVEQQTVSLKTFGLLYGERDSCGTGYRCLMAPND